MANMTKCVLHSTENICIARIVENDDYRQYILSHNFTQKLSLSRTLKIGFVLYSVNYSAG